MLGVLTSLLASPKNIIMILGLVAIGGLGWKVYDFVDEKNQFEIEIVELKGVVERRNTLIENLNTNIRVLETSLKTAQNTARIRQEVNTEIATDQEAARRLINSIINSEEADDGEISPILRNALRGINGGGVLTSSPGE